MVNGEDTVTRRSQSKEQALPQRRSPWRGKAPLVLVPLDGSEEAKTALPVARVVAQASHASIQVIHAADRPLSHDELVERVGLRREEMRGLVVEHSVGTAVDVVIGTAGEKAAMLIAMATRGRTDYRGRVVRPNVEETIRRSPCPVLLVRPETRAKTGATTRLRRLLLPLDGAPSSAAVTHPALELADRAEAEVDLVFVADRGRSPQEPGTLTAPRYLDQPQHEWPAWVAEFLSRFGTALGHRAAGPSTRIFLRAGRPADEILRLALERDSDLIVLGWRGRMDSDHGRVAQEVLRMAPCPVLLLRTSEDAAEP